MSGKPNFRFKCRSCAAIFAMAASTAAWAGPKDAAVEAAVDKAVADWAPVLSCSAVMPQDMFQVLDHWTKDRTELAAILIKAGAAPDVITRIAAKTEPAAMMAATQGSAAAFIAYCQAEDRWEEYLLTIAVPSLKRDVEKAIAGP